MPFLTSTLLCVNLGGPFAAMAAENDQSLAHFEDGIRHWKSGNREAALVAIESSAERITPSAYRVDVEIAFHRKGGAGLEGARKDFRSILLGPPDAAEAHYFVGNVLSDRGNSTDAIHEYQLATHLKPGHAEGQFNLGLQWAFRGRWDFAATPIRAAVLLTPDDPEPHLLLAMVLVKIEHESTWKEAVREAKEAARLLPTSPYPHYILGVAYSRLARREEAAEELRAFVALAKASPSTTRAIAKANDLLDQMTP